MNDRILQALLYALIPALVPIVIMALRAKAPALYERVWRPIRSRVTTKGDIVLRQDRMESLVRDVLDKVQRVLHEVLPNNGGSLRDENRQQFLTMLAMFSSPEEGQFYTNRAGQWIWANETFQRWTGMDVESLSGMGFLSALSERHQEPFEKAWTAAIEQHREFRGLYLVRGVRAPTDHEPGGVAHFRTEWRLVKVRDPKTDEVVGYSGSVKRVVTQRQPVVASYMLPDDGA